MAKPKRLSAEDAPEYEVGETYQYATIPFPSVDGVEFRMVPDWPAYCVGTDGTVWSRWAGNHRGGLGVRWFKMRGRFTRRYVNVHLRSTDGRSSNFQLHRIVLTAFVGPCPEGMVGRHFPDRNTRNNSLSNLRWGTQKENQADRLIHGTDNRGSRQGASKLTEADIPLIRLDIANKVPMHMTAKRFGVSASIIWRIADGRAWAWLK